MTTTSTTLTDDGFETHVLAPRSGPPVVALSAGAFAGVTLNLGAAGPLPLEL